MMDRLTELCLPRTLRLFVQQYAAPQSERAIVKQVPLTEENRALIAQLGRVIPIRRRYRGPRNRTFGRECVRARAERVSVYTREWINQST